MCRKQCSNGGRCIGPNRLELERKVHPKVLYHGEGPSVITNLRVDLRFKLFNRCACVYGFTGRHCEIDYRLIELDIKL